MARQPPLQFFPDPVIRPLRQIFIRSALEIKARDLWTTHTVESETALMVAVDQFFGRRRCLRQNAEPCERKIPLIDRQRVFNARATHPVKSVATRNKIALNFRRFAMIVKSYLRGGGIKVMNSDTFAFKESLPSGFQPRRDKVFHHFLLGVDRDPVPRECFEIDTMPSPSEANFHAV